MLAIHMIGVFIIALAYLVILAEDTLHIAVAKKNSTGTHGS